jgi:hypothetical protein
MELWRLTGKGLVVNSSATHFSVGQIKAGLSFLTIRVFSTYRKYVSTMRTAILNEGGIYASGESREMIQAVLSKEASTASGTVIRTNQSFG